MCIKQGIHLYIYSALSILGKNKTYISDGWIAIRNFRKVATRLLTVTAFAEWAWGREKLKS